MRKKALLLTAITTVIALGAVAYSRMEARIRREEATRALAKAVTSSQSGAVEVMLAEGADPHAREEFPPRPASLWQWIRTLLSPPPASENENRGRTLLQCAMDQGDYHIADLLLKHGASLKEYRVPYPGKILLEALGNPERLRLLLAHGADLREADGEGNTPLAIASLYGFQGSVQDLLDAGANPNAPDIPYLCPLGRAIQGLGGSQAEVVRMLFAHGARVPADPARQWDLAAQASGSNAVEIFRMLLDHGLNPNAASLTGVPVLHYAAYVGADPRIIRLLLAHRADPNRRGGKGNLTALAWARKGRAEKAIHWAIRPHNPLMDLLRQAGAQ